MERVVGTLACMMNLTAGVLARRQTWRATLEEQGWMEDAAQLTGRTLPAAAFTSASEALQFLLQARYALEAKAVAMGAPGPQL